MRKIQVTAAKNGYRVAEDQGGEGQTFASRQAAECAALSLADDLARTGETTVIIFHLEDGAWPMRFLRPADSAAANGPSADAFSARSDGSDGA